MISLCSEHPVERILKIKRHLADFRIANEFSRSTAKLLE